MSDEELVKAFHAMWGNFPEPVMIIQKSREVMAVNDKAAAFGLKVGMKCSSVGTPEQHKGCLANRAADNKETVAITYEGPFGKSYGYWIPLADRPEWMLHFGVGSTFAYEETNIKR
ncbi:MAG: hypothetical protein K6C05_04180 [Anaerovibrio sp.]|uniref:hypothetical protein n=1 Tax=Anaerovibrio sp. TaxID=1872532 RepID=UPI0025F011FB|nr:hypothetical protein [Anaerovibrio sp.]MCR5176027.1 hypothetical protein [Anaerovibrio sp.]